MRNGFVYLIFKSCLLHLYNKLSPIKANYSKNLERYAKCKTIHESNNNFLEISPRLKNSDNETKRGQKNNNLQQMMSKGKGKNMCMWI